MMERRMSKSPWPRGEYTSAVKRIDERLEAIDKRLDLAFSREEIECLRKEVEEIKKLPWHGGRTEEKAFADLVADRDLWKARAEELDKEADKLRMANEDFTLKACTYDFWCNEAIRAERRIEQMRDDLHSSRKRQIQSDEAMRKAAVAIKDLRWALADCVAMLRKISAVASRRTLNRTNAVVRLIHICSLVRQTINDLVQRNLA
jgi:hypothetical protein